ncbi:YpiF family protein [Bacillus sp. AGMB 02131]|uniref:YpiF family protein n=1 Tax=Peribacillus faecalis TaxID=2772559 RepID=A0A927CZ84_9BACI|nr:YpiF family protein [Peribacillus faecalis]MBD3110402.1 YpiF family protein [Peribacillus faecalis]
MKWLPQDMDMFFQAREYVDTAVMPLIGLTFKEQAKQSASVHDFISIVSRQVEQQFKGRVLLMPPLTYCSDWSKEERLELLLKWKADLDKQFSHVLFLTSDAEWKTLEMEIGQSLLWISPIPLEHLEEKYKQPMMEEQVKMLLKVISQKWKK